MWCVALCWLALCGGLCEAGGSFLFTGGTELIKVDWRRRRRGRERTEYCRGQEEEEEERRRGGGEEEEEEEWGWDPPLETKA